jgi:hypothetical protein
MDNKNRFFISIRSLLKVLSKAQKITKKNPKGISKKLN